MFQAQCFGFNRFVKFLGQDESIVMMSLNVLSSSVAGEMQFSIYFIYLSRNKFLSDLPWEPRVDVNVMSVLGVCGGAT